VISQYPSNDFLENDDMEASVVAYGETLTVRQDDSNGLWVTSCGNQYSSPFDALKEEIRTLVSASGENPDDCRNEIEDILFDTIYY
jgi:hypothetical protein